MDSLFKIEKLRQFASFALDSTDYQPADSARVRAVPDVRTIRYYTTIGLIDRPAEMRGRTAMYGLGHVEQLVAIKRLQSEGLTLSDIQHRVIGIPAKELSKIANLPKDLQKKFSTAESSSAESSSVEEVSQAQETITPSQSAKEPWNQVPRSRRAPISPKTVGIKRVVRLSLSSSVSVEVEINDQDTSNLDLDTIRKSAEPLLREIRRQQKLQNVKHEGEATQ